MPAVSTVPLNLRLATARKHAEGMSLRKCADWLAATHPPYTCTYGSVRRWHREAVAEGVVHPKPGSKPVQARAPKAESAPMRPAPAQEADDDGGTLVFVRAPIAVELTDELIDRVCARLIFGVPGAVGAGACGVHRDTHDKWLAKGSEDRKNGMDTLEARYMLYTGQAQDQFTVAYAKVACKAGLKGAWRAMKDHAAAAQPQRGCSPKYKPPAAPDTRIDGGQKLTQRMLSNVQDGISASAGDG